MRYYLLYIMLVLGANVSWANDTLLVNKDFRFTDGLYHNIDQLQANQPAYEIGRLDGRLVLQEEAYLLKIEHLYPLGHPTQRFDLTGFPIIVLKGIPYIRARQDEGRQFTVYAGLRVRGRLCYYAYEEPGLDTMLMKAYNPLTGKPFRQKEVVRETSQLQEYLLDLHTGEVLQYNLDNLLTAMANDEALCNTLSTLPIQEAENRMQKALLIYDDRNPIYLPAPLTEQ